MMIEWLPSDYSNLTPAVTMAERDVRKSTGIRSERELDARNVKSTTKHPKVEPKLDHPGKTPVSKKGCTRGTRQAVAEPPMARFSHREDTKG
jgi:hypothetical protein